MIIKVANPKHNDNRVLRKFLLLPTRINEEVRWLCFANIQQRYEAENYADDGWHNECFILNEKA